MKLGIIAKPVEQGFKMAAAKKLDFVEFCINFDVDTDKFFADISKIKEWSEQYNVAVGSVGRWGSERIDKQGKIIEKELEISYKLIDAANEFACPVFVCGCNYVEELSYYENCTSAINYFSKLIDYGKKKNVKIATYNCHMNNFVHGPMAWTVIHGYLKDLGIKFDPSQTSYTGMDYLKQTKDWGERFNHVHLKGTIMLDGERYEHPPAGMDEIDWPSFIALLYKKGYTGGLSIEPHSETWTGDLGDKGIDYTIEYMNKLIFRNKE